MEIKDKELRYAKPKWPEVRCGQCNRLLFRGIVEDMEIKCSRCGAIQYIGDCKQEARMNVCNR
ncbi:MAG: Mu-like prophage protein Com [Firmicutes bacterium]|jgi:phage FluMu protein Com|nr:Mu-like prophage protein Com [Bacillota bacterium]